MFNLFSAFLIVLIIYEILALNHLLKQGDKYWNGFSILLNDLIKAIEILENASVGSYFTLSLHKGAHKIIVLKNQDSSKWWFEILINPKKKFYYIDKEINKRKILNVRYSEIFSEYYSKFNYKNLFKDGLPSGCPKKFNNYRRFILDESKEKLSNLLIDYFRKRFSANLNDKIYLSFYNTYVERGISPDIII